MRLLNGLIALAISALCGCVAAPRGGDTLIAGVTVLDGSGGAPQRGAAVLVAGGRIAAVVPAGARRPPARRTIDGKGGYLLPGFIDMHAHLMVPACNPAEGAPPFDRALSEKMLSALLDFGVTFVRSPATPTREGLAMRDDLNAARVRGPRAVASAEFVNNSKMSDPDVRRYVREALPYRPDYFKAYASLRPEQVASLVDEAHRHGLPVIGHLQRTSWAEGLRIGVDQLTHAVDWSEASLPPSGRAAYAAAVSERGPIRARIDWLELFDPESPETARLIEELARRQVPLDPTLVAYDSKFSDPASGRYRRNPHVDVVPGLHAAWRTCGGEITSDWTAEDYSRWRAAWPKLQRFVRLLHEGGALLTTGSDLTNPWVIPGESLHQEFELLAEAGIAPAAILRMTGAQAARALGRDDIGLIAPGRSADLVLLRDNPLEEIGNSRSILWVMQGGEIVSEGPAAVH